MLCAHDYDVTIHQTKPVFSYIAEAWTNEAQRFKTLDFVFKFDFSWKGDSRGIRYLELWGKPAVQEPRVVPLHTASAPRKADKLFKEKIQKRIKSL